MAESTLTDVANLIKATPNYLETYGNLKVNEADANLKNAQASLQRYEALVKTSVAAKNFAEAAKLRAEAEKIMAEVRLLHAVIDQLKHDLRILNRQYAKMDASRKRLEDKVKLVNRLLRGRRFGASPSGAWGALDYFVGQIYDDAVFSSIEILSSARAAHNFIHWKLTSAVAVDVPEEIDHILWYADWMREKGFLARAGRPAQKLLRRLIGAAESRWSEERADLEDRMKKMKQGVYENWHLPHLLGRNIPEAAVKAAERLHATEVPKLKSTSNN